jgi:putative DNA methylase
MLKRLIEVALPLKEVSEHSAREKSIRHGHISTLHIWWARRPLAACRAAVFASLIPDPDDPECPEEFRKLVMNNLGKNQFKPTNGDGSSIEDTPRNRCLEFIKYLVRWENSNNPEYIDPARKLIAAAHKFLHPDTGGDAPKVLDPFAGGGAIPLEALRLGCEAHAIDLNPVAHLIELCTLVYPQKFGHPNSRSVPNYINWLKFRNLAKRKAKGESGLFDEGDTVTTTHDEIIPDVEITDAEYRKNPLAADVKYWAHWVEAYARQEIGNLYPPGPDHETPLAYIWARTVKCVNPTCGGIVPLVQQLSLVRRSGDSVAIRMTPNANCEPPSTTFNIAKGREIDFDPNQGTMSRTSASCPYCHTTIAKRQLEVVGVSEGFGSQLMAVIAHSSTNGKVYLLPDDTLCPPMTEAPDEVDVPSEPLPYLRSIFNCHVYGIRKWASLFSPRQLLCVSVFARGVREASNRLFANHDEEYAAAVNAYLGLVLDRLADFNTMLCAWKESAGHTFARQALGMIWDYCEVNPFSSFTGSWQSQLRQVIPVIESCSEMPSTDPATVIRGSAATPPIEANTLHAVITDPPYYDAVPYADLSDFFYVWLKRSLCDTYKFLVSTPLTPKGSEIVQLAGRNKNYDQKTAKWFEEQMRTSFRAWGVTLVKESITAVMYAHKLTSAWESLISGLLQGGFYVTASWPLHTEMGSRLRAQGAAALASSIIMVCRIREAETSGIWDDVRQELKEVAQERLEFFWNQGIRGADFFVSAIGPALSVFGKYERVTKLSGEEVTVGQFLDEVRSLVTNYALTKILHTTHIVAIDPESRFYVVWRWSYGDAKVPADESFKLSQALGMHTEEMWDRTGVLEKSGENVQGVPISTRMKMKNLGEPTADGAPASLIDVLHRLCAFREKSDTQGMAQFLGQSGHANNPTLWLLAQAISEILPDGDKEKQRMQGLLNQREGLEEATRQRGLF